MTTQWTEFFRVETVDGSEEKRARMEAVREACRAAGVPVPDEVHNFLAHGNEGEPMPLSGNAIDDLDTGTSDRIGIRIDITKVPEGTTHILVSYCY